MLIGIAYLAAAVICIALIKQGWSGWLYLLSFLCLYNGLKFLLFGPWSLVLLIRWRIAERRHRRAGSRNLIGSPNGVY